VVNLEDFILLEVLYIGSNGNSRVGVPKSRHVFDVSSSKLEGVLLFNDRNTNTVLFGRQLSDIDSLKGNMMQKYRYEIANKCVEVAV
jgi:hypothetical protein